MKLLIQRVTEASFTVDGEVISSIGRGLCVLVGIHKTDTKKELDNCVRKLLNFRLFSNGGENEDEAGSKRWDKSVKDKNYEILCCSQFTLYYVMKGNKPDFHQNMEPEKAQIFYHEFVSELRKAYQAEKVQTGKFGTQSSVKILNDGPVTMEIEYTATPPKESQK